MTSILSSVIEVGGLSPGGGLRKALFVCETLSALVSVGTEAIRSPGAQVVEKFLSKIQVISHTSFILYIF